MGLLALAAARIGVLNHGVHIDLKIARGGLDPDAVDLDPACLKGHPI